MSYGPAWPNLRMAIAAMTGIVVDGASGKLEPLAPPPGH